MSAQNPRHYIIVVHGMGEQKHNETAPEVVQRFAEVRHKDKKDKIIQYRHLLPANLSGQSIRRRGMGHGWSEFNGIPIFHDGNTGKFDGLRATDTSGENFRFVDLRWAHILQRHQEAYASPIEKWAPALLKRIEIAPKEWLPPWAAPMLNAIVDTALPIKTILQFRYPKAAKLIFDGILGDVHLYGDYTRTRGKAVRHFHVILDEILLRDFIDWCRLPGKNNAKNYQLPEFTVIAHSLGTVLSFDALVYAHVKKDIRSAPIRSYHPCPSLPFPGYTERAPGERITWRRLIDQLDKLDENTRGVLEEKVKESQINKDFEIPGKQHPDIPPLMWRGCVKKFITLGAPVDKFHVVWYQNYLHMGLRKEVANNPGNFVEFDYFKKNYAEGWLDKPDTEIVHYNLCDEQDPVGHHLDVAQASENYEKIFDTSIPVAYRDVVFRRYSVPGLAHVKYWEDEDLFKGIIKEVIDKRDNRNLKSDYFVKDEFREGDGSVYRKALTWAYFRVPFVAAMVTGVLLVYAFFGSVPIYRIVAILAAPLLWVRPHPVKVYAKEAEVKPEEDKVKRYEIGRSIFAHLVAGMVEWRRVLILMSKGKETEIDECLEEGVRLAFKKKGKPEGVYRNKRRKRYWWAIALAILGLLLSVPLALKMFAWLPWRGYAAKAGFSLFILSATYLATQVYVYRLYLQAKKGKKKKAA